jgi:hypothetical protein
MPSSNSKTQSRGIALPSNLRERVSTHFRAKRDVVLRNTLWRAARGRDTLRILDLGGRPDYWRRVGYRFLEIIGAQIVLLNVREAEIATEDEDAPEGMFRWEVGDARALDYPDYTFDLCHSNSVIEHVGLWEDMASFAAETRRVAPSYYVQTPNFWFPVEPHFYAFPMNHWLPRPLRAKLMMTMNLATAGRADNIGHAHQMVDSARLLTAAQMQFLFPEADPHYMQARLLAKSLLAIYVSGETRPAY